MATIEFKDVRFCYGEKNRCFRALDHLNLKIESGEFACLLGRSGCGKTTLLRLIAGLQKPTEGEVLIDGKPVEGPGTDRAVVFQNYTLFPWLTSEKNIAFALKQAAHSLSRAEIMERTRHYLELVEMQDAAAKYPNELSGGMKQRVAIAKALAMDSDILLMDEPFGALDTKIRASLQDLVEQLWLNDGKKTVLFVTHDVHEAVRLAGKVVYMEPGRIESVLPIDLPRPRSTKDPDMKNGMLAAEESLRKLFYKNEENEEEEDGGTCCG